MDYSNNNSITGNHFFNSVLRDGIYVFGAEIFTDGFESGNVDMWSS